MTLEDIRRLVITVDPQISHHRSESRTENYSYWEESRLLPYLADDRHEEAWGFTVHRYSRLEDDPIARAFFRALDADPRVAFSYLVDYDRESGYVHHIFDCEGF